MFLQSFVKQPELPKAICLRRSRLFQDSYILSALTRILKQPDPRRLHRERNIRSEHRNKGRSYVHIALCKPRACCQYAR